VNDDYIGRIIASAPSGNVTELSTEAWFTVALETAPLTDVVVPIVSSDTTRGRVSLGAAVFSSSNWSLPVNVTVLGMNNDASDIDLPFTVTLGSARSTDELYDNGPIVVVRASRGMARRVH
jgi:hypothetical protein